MKILILEPHGDDILVNLHQELKAYAENSHEIDVVTITHYNAENTRNYLNGEFPNKIHHIQSLNLPCCGWWMKFNNRLGASQSFGDRFEFYRKVILSRKETIYNVLMIENFLIERLSKVNYDYIFCPMGIGHPDHFSTVFALQCIAGLDMSKVLYYKEHPYCYNKYYDKFLDELYENEGTKVATVYNCSNTELQSLMNKYYPTEWAVAVQTPSKQEIYRTEKLYTVDNINKKTVTVNSAPMSGNDQLSKAYESGDPWNCIRNVVAYKLNSELINRVFMNDPASIYVMGGGLGYEALFYRNMFPNSNVINVDFEKVINQCTDIFASYTIIGDSKYVDSPQGYRFYPEIYFKNYGDFYSRMKIDCVRSTDDIKKVTEECMSPNQDGPVVVVMTDMLYYVGDWHNYIKTIVDRVPVGSLIISGDSLIRHHYRTHMFFYVKQLNEGRSFSSLFPQYIKDGKVRRYYKACIGIK